MFVIATKERNASFSVYSSICTRVNSKEKYMKLNQFSSGTSAKRKERGVWFYSNSNSSQSTWTPFGDIDNEILEESFTKNRKKLQLDNSLIDLENLVQIDKKDSSIERPIKRCLSQDNQNSLRSERFYSSEKLVQSFNERNSNDHRFINECRRRCGKMSMDEMLEKAAVGIIEEGITLGKQVEAEWIAQEIRSVKGKSKADVEKCLIRLYTLESFLYRLINQTLRENDLDKLDTLAAFCQILFQSDCSPTTDKLGYEGELYRGAQLDEKTIQSYEQSIGLIKTWDAFSSTSQNRKKAESYGNVLFIVNRDKSTRYQFSGMDISAISVYPDEEEVLIRAARNFRVQKVDRDYLKGKSYIYLLLC